jgi:hypothetical protein
MVKKPQKRGDQDPIWAVAPQDGRKEYVEGIP